MRVRNAAHGNVYGNKSQISPQPPPQARPLPRARTAHRIPRRLHEAIMLAHGFTVPQMVELIRAGLATATGERVMAGSTKMEVARVRITDAGRRALATFRRR